MAAAAAEVVEAEGGMSKRQQIDHEGLLLTQSFHYMNRNL